MQKATSLFYFVVKKSVKFWIVTLQIKQMFRVTFYALLVAKKWKLSCTFACHWCWKFQLLDTDFMQMCLKEGVCSNAVEVHCGCNEPVVVDFIAYRSFQKAGVNITKMVKISILPISINAEQTHLIPAGSIDQLMVGPISRPNEGPTLPRVLSVMVMAFVLSTPAAMNMNDAKRHSNR